MSDPMRQAWSDVADGFTTLGRMMKERYRGAGQHEEGGAATPEVDAAVDPAAGTGADAGGGESASSPTVALREALDRLVAAGRELGDRAADVARDDDVKAQARQAAASLNEALSATVDLIGDEVGGLFARAKRAEQAEQAGPAASAGGEPAPASERPLPPPSAGGEAGAPPQPPEAPSDGGPGPGARP